MHRIHGLTTFPEIIISLSGPTRELHTVSSPGTADGTTGGAAPGLDLSCLDSAVRGSGLAPSTQKVYQSGSRRYRQFCSVFNVPVPFPVSEHTLMYFVAYLHQEGLAPGTVKSYLSAVHSPKWTGSSREWGVVWESRDLPLSWRLHDLTRRRWPHAPTPL